MDWDSDGGLWKAGRAGLGSQMLDDVLNIVVQLCTLLKNCLFNLSITYIN